jgi:hypothetical protein
MKGPAQSLQDAAFDLRSDRVVRCAVLDRGPASLPTGFRSLVFDRLADTWGESRANERTESWFETSVA